MNRRVLERVFAIRAKEGPLAQSRFLCATLVKRRHPRVAARVLPAIAACTDRLRLQMWMLEANEVSSAELDRVFGRSAVPRSSRRRKAPPARRARKPSAR